MVFLITKNRRRLAVSVAFCLVFISVGPSVATATACEGVAWKVSGKILEPGESKKIEESLEVEKAMTVEVGKNDIECTALSDKGGDIAGYAGGEVESLTFSKCSVTNHSTECEVAGGSTKTKPLNVVLDNLTNVELTPKEGTKFMTIEVKAKEGKTCATAGTFNLDGHIAANMPNGTTESSTHKLEFTEKSGSNLTEGADPVFLLVAGLALVGVLVFASTAR
jgi:hypothetical protein